jgi:hypothetical protein
MSWKTSVIYMSGFQFHAWFMCFKDLEIHRTKVIILLFTVLHSFPTVMYYAICSMCRSLLKSFRFFFLFAFSK